MDRNTKQRRRHNAEFKAQVLQACAVPGASVAAVAREFGLNDNLVHQWRRGRGVGSPQTAAQFIALPLPAMPPPIPAPSASTGDDINLEFKRGALQVSVKWPLAAASDCAAWLREVLR
jgi:transposase